jgi:hypothetical protein
LTDRQIEKIFDAAIREAAAIGATVRNFNPDKPFSFADYPITKERVDRLVKSFQKNVEAVVANGANSGWTLANNKNNALCDRVFGDDKLKLTKEQERRQQLDFVVGVEVRLSVNHPVADICDELKGKYPKAFSFTGWHPHCRCHTISNSGCRN